MNFNRLTTAIHFLEANNPRDFKGLFQVELILRPEMNVTSFMRQDFDALRPDFASNIFYTSESFMESFSKRQWSKMAAPPPPMEGATKGTWIAKTSGGFIRTVFFDLSYEERESDVLTFKGTVIGMLSHPDKRLPILAYFIHHDQGQTGSQKILKLQSLDMNRLLRTVYLLSHYIQNCDIEVKTMSSGNAGSPSISMGDYRNGTHLPINILDATWNTTYVHPECTVGEKTGGFFRNQPYGQGRSQRRVQWIPPFKRRSYVREARVSRLRERSDTPGPS